MGKRSGRYKTKPLVVDPYAQESAAGTEPDDPAATAGQTVQPEAALQQAKREIIKVDITQQENTVKKTPAAAYVRLSAENGNRRDEGTLQTQIDLVHDYIRQSADLELYDTFIDNGVSGTVAFAERPGFTQLMEAVKRGWVRCIVVKDLSRFGRDYLEAATYIEHVFPLLGVRLIAITDNFDSIRPEDVNGLALPVKNLINTMYAKDIGKKIKSSYDARDKAEKWFGTRVAYGYMKGGGPGNWTMVPDPETAGYVRVIFHWYISGASVVDIARRLDLTGVVTPSRRKSQYEKTKSEGKEYRVSDGWSDTSVMQILENPCYTGDIVNRRYYADTVALKNKEDWQPIPDKHEALISHEEFEKSWDIIEEGRRQAQKKHKTMTENKTNDAPLFSQRIVCGDCGRYFQVEYRGYGDGLKAKFYLCPNKDCIGSRKIIHEDVFKILIMDQLRILMRAACDYRKLAKELLSENPAKGKAGSIRVKLTNRRAELQRIEERVLKAYEDYVDGAIEREDYIRLKEKLAAEKKKAESAIGILEAEELELKDRAGEFLKTTENFEEYLDAEGYSAEIVDRLVDKIEYSTDGSLTLTLKCADVYEEVLPFLDEEEKDAQSAGLTANAGPTVNDESIVAVTPAD